MAENDAGWLLREPDAGWLPEEFSCSGLQNATDTDKGVDLRPKPFPPSVVRAPRESLRKSIGRQLNAPDHDFLRVCLGERWDTSELFSPRPISRASGASDRSLYEGTAAVIASGSESPETLERYRFELHGDSDDEKGEQLDHGQSLENMFRFDSTFTSRFTAWDDSDEDSDCDWDVEDLFSFDLEKVAQALKQGATACELEEIIEEAMSNALESRLAADAAAESPTGCGSSRRWRDDVMSAESGVSTPLMASSLSGRMTPVDESDEANVMRVEAARVASEAPELVRRIEEKLGAGSGPGYSRLRPRKSTALRHRLLADAVYDATERQNHHLARMGATAAGRRAIAKACTSHRLSAVRAAEVLEAAGVGVDDTSSQPNNGSTSAAQNPAAEPLRLVQMALEAAYRRHRRTVLKAVHAVTSPRQANSVASRLPFSPSQRKSLGEDSRVPSSPSQRNLRGMDNRVASSPLLPQRNLSGVDNRVPSSRSLRQRNSSGVDNCLPSSPSLRHRNSLGEDSRVPSSPSQRQRNSLVEDSRVSSSSSQRKLLGAGCRVPNSYSQQKLVREGSRVPSSPSQRKLLGEEIRVPMALLQRKMVRDENQYHPSLAELRVKKAIAEAYARKNSPKLQEDSKSHHGHSQRKPANAPSKVPEKNAHSNVPEKTPPARGSLRWRMAWHYSK